MALITKVPGLIVDETSNFTFANANVTGNLTSGNANLGNLATANYVAGTLTTALQPNITQVGSLDNLTVTGNVTAGAIKTNSLLYANGEAYAIGGGITIAGTNTQVQFNNTGSFGASANFTFNNSTNTLSADKIAADGGLLSNIAAANVTGTVANAAFATSAGTATSATTAATAATVTTNAQPNITSVGTLSGLTVNGNIAVTNADLGNAATANYFIGSGANLSNLQASNITGTVANATYATSAGTATSATSATTATTATTAGTVTTAAQPNITSVGTLSSLTVTGNVTAAHFIGSGNTLSNLQASNVTGTVANATYATSAGTATSATTATTAGTVTTNAQPNITSVGTLSGLTVNGNVTAVNADLGNAVTANYFLGSGANLSNIQASNVTGTVANATFATSAGTATSATTATTAGIVTTNAQPNITSVGTLSGLTVNGNVTATNANLGNAVTANYYIGNGSLLTGITAGTSTTAVTITANAQPNITSTGTLTSLVVGNATSNTTFGNGTITALGNIAFSGDNVSLGSVSNLHITGGTANYVLQTDGSGNLSWVAAAAGGGGGAVSGSNTQIQFNDGGVLGASANLSFNKTSNTLSTDRLVAVNGANLGSVANVYITGGTANYVLQTDGSGNLSWAAAGGEGGVATIVVDNFTGTGSQTTFTLSVIPTSINQTVINYNGAFQLRSAYTLSGANVIFTEAPESGSAVEVTTTQGLISGAGAFVTRTYTGNGTANTYAVTSGSTVSSVLVSENGLLQTPTTDYTISGSTLTFVSAPGNGIQIQVRELAIAVAEFSGNLGAVANLTITGGTNGQVLTSNGASGVSWQTITVPTVPESLSPFLFL